MLAVILTSQFSGRNKNGRWARNPARLALGVLPTCALALGVLPAWAQAPAPNWQQPLSADKKITQVLNRLEFGPRPGDFERVQKMGVERWIDWQLSPEKIDDSAVNQKLSVLKTLQMTPQMLMLAQAGDSGLVRKAMQMQLQKKQNAPDNTDANANAANANPAGKKKRDELNARQMETLARIEDAGLPPQTSMQAVGELQLDKITRAVESKRQLYEIMVDFWSNHFNLDVKKNDVRSLIIVDERAVIRPHVFGTFRELLGASAKSPAMLVYLDNASSTRAVDANAPRGNRRRRNQNANANAPAAPAVAPKKRGGINENYAREIMELHTLGVDGGYTQQDVQEVARCFTGWSVDRQTGQFMFRRYAHDDGEKTVLGQRIPAGGGIQDGERVLDILASQPATAKHISRELCERLVADEPPQSVVDKAAQTFTDTKGDLRAVVKTIVTSPEFFSTGAYRAKIKSPFEYAVSAVRALDGVVLLDNGSTPEARIRLISDGAASARPGGNRYNRYKSNVQKTMAQQIAEMGQPLYSYQAPTGYSEDSSKWVSTGAFVARLNFALALVDGNVYNVLATPTLLLKDVDEHDRTAITNRLLEDIVGGDVSPGTRSTLLRETKGEDPVDRMKLTALILGSPEFQRR